jgi:hypothetical protein
MSSRPAQQPIHIDIGSTIGTRGGVFGMAQWMLSSLCVFVGALCLTGLAQPVWPKTSAVDALATEAKRLGNTGIKNAYVYVDIKCPPKNQACSCLANRSWVVGLCALFFCRPQHCVPLSLNGQYRGRWTTPLWSRTLPLARASTRWLTRSR